jgi:hypothetical protein
MALLVSNGQLTEGTVDRLTEFVKASVSEQTNYSSFLVIEAVPDDELGEGQQVRVEIKPLTSEQHSDALFQNYDKNNGAKIRQTFRMPPLLVGRSDDYTRATAETSRRLADEQIFNPERLDEDWEINRVLADMGMLYHRFQTNTPNVTNDQDLIAVMKGAETTGGMTPRLSRRMLGDIVGEQLGPVSDEVKPDVPFSLQMAEAVKNMANPAIPGQQVTATKAMLRVVGMEEDLSRQLDFMELRKGELPVVVDVGSQAGDIADGSQTVLLSPVCMGLDGPGSASARGSRWRAPRRRRACKPWTSRECGRASWSCGLCQSWPATSWPLRWFMTTRRTPRLLGLNRCRRARMCRGPEA